MEKARPEDLRRHVEYLAAIDPPRSFEHHSSLELAATYISAGFRNAGVAPMDQIFPAGGKVHRNVRAHLGPSRGEYLIIGAHYDVAGDQPGADDNASGVAALLELARLLAPVQEELKGPVELVAYTLEEPPHFAGLTMGSHVHAQLFKNENLPVKLMIALEMIGYFKDSPETQTYPLDAFKYLYPTQGNFIAIVGRLQELFLIQQLKKSFRGHTDLPVHTLAAPNIVEGVDMSDHRNFWEAGFHAVMITDTAYFRNPNYHSRQDRPETLDYTRMAEVVNGLVGIAREF